VLIIVLETKFFKKVATIAETFRATKRIPDCRSYSRVSTFKNLCEPFFLQQHMLFEQCSNLLVHVSVFGVVESFVPKRVSHATFTEHFEEFMPW
jgi:hypothetical protein